MTNKNPDTQYSEYERRETICTNRAMAQWQQSLSRKDLDEEARVKGAIEAYKRQALAFSISPSSEQGSTDVASTAPNVSVQTMILSDGRADHYVSIRVGDRQVHPHVFREEFKAAYHVALYEWLLNGGLKPDLMAFGKGEWPAQATELVGADPGDIAKLEKRVDQLEDELNEALSEPWPEWATAILETLKENGYDPGEDGGQVDLAEAFSEYLADITQEDELYKRELAEKDAEIARLKAVSLAVKPLEWVDEASFSGEDGPTYSQAVGAGYTYVAEAIDGKELPQSKLEAEGRYLRNVLGTVSISPTIPGDESLDHAAIHTHGGVEVGG
jgi:hypothetical protein